MELMGPKRRNTPIEYPDLGGPGDRKLYPIDEAVKTPTLRSSGTNWLMRPAQGPDFLKEHTDDNVRYTFG